jgi:hypothetical protein
MPIAKPETGRRQTARKNNFVGISWGYFVGMNIGMSRSLAAHCVALHEGDANGS